MGGVRQAVEEIVKIAKAHGVEAIHPGYGFLSERSDFAQLCQKEGIAFVGPDFRTLDQMGDKTAARAIAIECEVPVIPGTDGAVSTLEEAEAFVEQFGCPVIMKVRGVCLWAAAFYCSRVANRG
jgi:pyruvate carboxylase